MISFHTPKLPAPLGLDLASLTGGGSCPSQFYGETHDGQEVSARYRGGKIRVDIGDNLGGRRSDEDRVLEVHIGPDLDGTMSLTQFCRYFGVTVNGKVPDEGDKAAHRYKDLSGRTTFWVAHQEWVTLETSRKIITALQTALPQPLLVVPVVDERYRLQALKEVDAANIADTQCWLIDGATDIGEIEISPTDYLVSNDNQLHIRIDFALWHYPNPRYSSRHLKRISEELEKPLIVAGHMDMPDEVSLATDALNLSADFSSADRNRRDQLDQLGDVIKSFLPETRINRVDLRTGEILSHTQMPLDPVLHDWCSKGKDHWLFVSRDGREGPWTGLRPA